MLQVIQEVNSVNGMPICNEGTCPTMSAGRYVGHCGVVKVRGDRTDTRLID